MINDLIKMADKLDKMGLSKEANLLDDLIKKSSKIKNVEDVVSHFRSSPDDWRQAYEAFHKAISNPEDSGIMEYYPGWGREEFEKVYSAVEEDPAPFSLDTSDLLFLLQNHFDQNVSYKMSPKVISKITAGLKASGITGADLSEADRNILS